MTEPHARAGTVYRAEGPARYARLLVRTTAAVAAMAVVIGVGGLLLGEAALAVLQP